jgi:hypothetical protein
MARSGDIRSGARRHAALRNAALRNEEAKCLGITQADPPRRSSARHKETVRTP